MSQSRKGAFPVVSQPPRKERAPQTATALHEVFKVVKTMQTEGLNWGEGCRPPGRQAVAKIAEGVDR